jgi:2-methylcitrate dehydratase PrpD
VLSHRSLRRDSASGYHKAYGCCQYAHSAIEATLAALSDPVAAIDSSRVRRVTVETHKLGLSLANYAPETSLAAKFSLPHCIASTIVCGNAGHRTFGAPSLADPRIAALRGRIDLIPYLPDDQPWPYDRPARVTIETDDGRRVQRDCQSANGGPDRPLSEQDLFMKVDALAGSRYPGLAREMFGLLDLAPGKLAGRWPELLERALR